MTDDVVESRIAANIVLTVLISLLTLPAAAYLLFVILGYVFDFRRRFGHSQALANASSIIAAVGFLALPTTPIGVIVTFFARKRLRTPLGQMGTAMAVVGAVGWVLIVLEFVLIG